MMPLPLIVGLCSSMAWAGIPPGLTFHATFEDTLNASEASGNKQGTGVGKPKFTEGRVGRGVIVGDVDGAAGVEYETKGNFNVERGSVALWVKPLNWQGDDKQNHIFFNAWPGEQGLFSLYKYSNVTWGLTFYLDPEDGARGKIYIYKPINEWKPGQWHHIACTWTRFEGMRLYIDGELVNSLAGTPMTNLPLKPTVRFGGDWQKTGGKTVIDDAMIFNRMLAPHEVATLADKSTLPPPSETPRDVPGVMMTQAVLAHRVLAHVYNDALGQPILDSARLSFTPEGAHKPTASKDYPLKGTFTSFDFDLTSLPMGRYQARLDLMSGGKAVAAEALTVSEETKDTWKTAKKVGKADTVLPPFKPIITTATGVKCVIPEYAFGGDGLMTKARAMNQDLLAAPVRIKANTAGSSLPFAPGQLKRFASSHTEARFTGDATSPSLKVATAVTARYDATVWTTVEFQPQKPMQLDRLSIEVPIAAELAKYLAYIGLGRVDEKRLGYDALPAGDGTIWSREFLPSLWIGTEDRGIGWFAESDEHWDIDGENALTLARRGSEVVLSMNIVRKPRQVDKPFTIEFGVQATPIRPLQPDWRQYQWISSNEISKFFLELRKRPYPRLEVEGKTPRGKVCYLYTYHDYFTSTLPKDPGEFREMLDRAKSFGLLCTPYTDTTFLPENHGDFLMNYDEMRCSPAARGCRYGPVCNVSACHRGPFGDWFAWYVSHLVREYGSNGIYLDDMWPYGCMNESHGCGYVGPDGKRRLTYSLRARLETYRRIREVLAETGKPFWVNYHISGGRVPPLPTFGDCLLLAEDRHNDVAKNPDSTENITPAQLRAGYSPQAWGIPVAFIPQFKINAEWMKNPDLAAKLMTAVVPHDLMVWPLFSDTDTVMKYRDALVAFGIGEADTVFLPYWRTDTGLACDNKDVLVSGYLRPGKLLLCVSNYSKENLSVDISLETDRLKLAGERQATDVFGAETMPLRDGWLHVPVPAKRMRLLEITAIP